MIKQQPAFGRFDGDRTGSDLCALPAAFDAHHEAMLAPMDHVRGLTEVDVTKRGMAIVTGTVEHHIFSTDFPGEEYPIAVERQKRIFEEMGFFKVKGIPDANGRAPAYIIAVL
jgi:hypothetical protein